MILKYIKATVFNTKKHYEFSTNNLLFDEDKNSIILSKEYIENDMNINSCFIESILYDELLERKLYSSMNNIKRAIKSGVLELSLSITYCNNINKSSRTYYKFIDKVTSLKDVDIYCSAVRYYYNLYTKELRRFEIYGDIIIGNQIEREESYYNNENIYKRLKEKGLYD